MAKVIVYSTTWCPWCTRVKEFLKQNKIAFRDVDVGEDRNAAEEMMKKSGQMGVPVVDIDGKIIVGFNEPEMRKALKL
jgi:glutaredoxin-like YruB-family protein